MDTQKEEPTNTDRTSDNNHTSMTFMELCSLVHVKFLESESQPFVN